SILVGVLTGAAGMRAWLSSRLRPPAPAALSAFWLPLLKSPDPVILCVSTPAQSFLRTLPGPPVNVPGSLPVDAAVTAWHAKQRVETHGPYLLQVPTVNSPLWGDAAGAARVAQMLGQNGIQTEMMAERVIALPALRNRNVVFLGTSEYSSGVSRLLKGLPLGIAYDETAADHIALEYDAADVVTKRYPVKRSGGHLTEVYGLITRVKGDGDAEKSSLYVVLSGVSSAGILAAAQYVTSPHHLERLTRSLTTDWQSQPLQVLIRVRADRTLPLSFEYVTHFVGPAKPSQ
ncbi:MAG: hypothetical protein H7039_08195, partial [Bryobacteraceae bacterium]|nr:hypothetical protein [Bryobacteraceae bacterium]